MLTASIIDRVSALIAEVSDVAIVPRFRALAESDVALKGRE
jgi:hypothetical protein